jgi:fatty acid desaturase
MINANHRSQAADRGCGLTGEVRILIKKLSKPNLALSLRAAVLDHLVIIAAGTLSYSLCMNSNWLALALLYPVLSTIAGRSMRGLECLVHEASHCNLSRARRLNDMLADLLFAWPVLSEVDQYRQSHLIHHRFLGHETDPDRVRYERLNLQKLDRSTTSTLIFGILIRLLPYIPSWWWAIGVSSTTVIRFGLWHVTLFGVPMALLLGLRQAVIFWCLTWAIPLFIVLPIIRFVAEAAEHEYVERNSAHVTAKTTWNNIGWVHEWIFHPHNDGYHAVHHLYPFIPHHALRTAHEHLMRKDSTYSAITLIRHSLAQQRKT